MTAAASTDSAAASARDLWLLVEPIHTVTYFAPEARAAYEAAGLRGYWRGYFAGRAAPLGAVGPELVTATFFGFHPDMVARAMPSVWELCSPEKVLQVREAGAVEALQRCLPGLEAEVAAAAPLARRAAELAPLEGRPLFAAMAALPWPEEPLAQLWHATGLIREHRGDGHIACLVAAGLDACESLVLQVAGGRMRQEDMQPNRGWSDEEWEASRARLEARGLVTGSTTTAEGEELRTWLEARTDDAAASVVRALGRDDTAALLAALAPLKEAVLAAAVVPFPNPMGMPR